MQLQELMRRIQYKARGRVVYIPHKASARKGSVLLSYITHPFLATNGERNTSHTHYWEAYEIARIFSSQGYDVDVIDATNTHFIPHKPYVYCVDIDGNLERLASLLPVSCKKILFTTTSHWKFNNEAEQKRLDDIALRRGISFPKERFIASNNSPLHADCVLYGNTHMLETYHLPPGKERVLVPISTTHIYPKPEKDFVTARTGFVWLGGAGLIHKGVDLLVEAFAKQQELTLSLCGKHNNPLFESTYAKELALPSIVRNGMVELGSAQFEKIRQSHAFVISTSCAEGQSGAVVVGMHAGLIPIVSKESGIDTADFGFTLTDCSVETIAQTIRKCAQLSPEELSLRAVKAWEYANKHHTHHSFSNAFQKLIDSYEKNI